ncbi:MAG TPA: cell wall-binding repeat-containing protein [Thermoleophilaceae bacterium]|nr:cell wall-binding repeat-containing protein [Thermoleophilaceae bacterium]
MRANRLTAATLVALAAAAAGGCSLGDDDSRPPQLGPASDGDEAAAKLGFPSTATRNTIRVGGDDAAGDAAGVANAAFPSTTDSNRPNAVVLVDSDDWQGAVTGALLAAKPIGAPLLLSDGDELPNVSADTLERLDPRGSDLSEDAQVIRIGDAPAKPDGYRTARIEGADAYERAAAIDRFFSAARGAPSKNVVVASGERAEFAMPAAAWAARSGDTVLLTERDNVPAATRKALAAHDKPNIFVLGPPSVVSDKALAQLRKLGRTTRIGAAQPVANAIEFARYEEGDFGWGATVPGYNFTVAGVSRPLNAAAAATLATRGVFAPLLLTDNAKKLPTALESYFLSVQPGYEDDPGQAVYNRVWILGDDEQVSVDEQAQLDAVTELIPVQPQAP